jgi:hypothetical protein
MICTAEVGICTGWLRRVPFYQPTWSAVHSNQKIRRITKHHDGIRNHIFPHPTALVEVHLPCVPKLSCLVGGIRGIHVPSAK